ncbi:Mu transposase C-terminal domain-containing protein [Lysobacter sp. S4-A87]|uniref:Mu transposase C-terminal domain-containing protein n=1 Tax=Lysobacter sp. S4-A87 TaxID=2925843 RepID=UPI001F539A3D|nr:Mu transposase C-terminal domain-containing protein [Lysobacter sp. S4-A87]UNK49856.1 Mu transposase C-terminal domain-containing protein [Lysobacter sp. S4-A87]
MEHDLPEDSWPMYGLPKKVRTDRAAEFRGLQFKGSCKAWGIEPLLRRKKEDGGIIERGIGKIQARAALEPGATGSDPKKQRGERDPSDYAQMSIKEAERWLAREITGRFHYERNDELGMSPSQAWQAAHSTGGELRLPPIVSNQKEFLISFLPWEMRCVTPKGVQLFKEFYYCSELIPFVGNKIKYKVHYDPRRLGRIYIEAGKDPKDPITVPYADPSKPCLPKFEVDARRRRQKEAYPNEYDRAQRVAHNTAQAADRRTSKMKTREARRKERLHQAAVQAGADIPRDHDPPPSPPKKVTVDYNRRPKVSVGGVV